LAVTLPQTASFRDAKGQTATVKFFVHAADEPTALTDAQAIVTALADAALTNAALQNAKGAYTTQPTVNTYGTNAVYETIEDKAMLTFETASGAIHRYQVPAPVAAIFLADDETVDPANAKVTALTAAMIGKACSEDGVLIASYIGGIRIRKKLKRKFNIFTLNPAETGPGE
jgi:hypothetical protein